MSARRPGPDPVDQWLDRHQRELADGLDGVLDVEAGLREALLQSRHDAAVDALGDALDVEGGLAAIVPAVPQDLASGGPESVVSAPPPAWQVDPVTRLALRADPHVAVAYQALNRTYFQAYKVGADFTRVRDLLGWSDAERNYEEALLFLAFALEAMHVVVLELARDVGRDATRDLGFEHELGRAQARALDRRIQQVKDRRTSPSVGAAYAHELVQSFTRDRDFARSVARTHTSVIAQVRDCSRLARSRARDRIRGLVRVLGAAEELARDLAQGIDYTLGLARGGDFAPLGDLVARGLSGDHAFRRVVVEVRANEVGRTIGFVLDTEPPPLGSATVRAFLDDFTASDLREADLTGVDLAGVRWSENGTRWPATVDVDDLKSRSEDKGGGIWVVRSPGIATVHDLAELA
ncbi:hypothetical protein [Streptomyces sp. NPDC001678]|uniref:hypothetical protein n=1 Tax=Streptomyces sp. NPDC001678 TaxID=3364599 RepID=UPI003699504C